MWRCIHIVGSGIELLQVERLVHEFEHAHGVFLHKFEICTGLGRQWFLAQHLTNGAVDERQRGAQLVEYAREEAQLALLEPLFHCNVAAQAPHIEQREYDGKANKHIQEHGPASLPECGMNIYLKLAGVVGPHAVGVGALHHERVFSCGDVAQRGAVAHARVAPLAVELLYPVGIAYQAIAVVVERREVDNGVALACRNLEHGLAEYWRYLLLALKLHTAEHYHGLVAALLYLTGTERQVTADDTEENLAAT